MDTPLKTRGLTALEALAGAREGRRFRHAAYGDWYFFQAGGWLFQPAGGAVRQVRASDWRSLEFLSRDFTTEEVGAGEDICARPVPVRPVYFFPSLRIDGAVSGDQSTITLSAVLGPASYGSYQLFFTVNGDAAAYQEAGEAGVHSVSVLVRDEWLAVPLVIKVRAVSMLPVSPWSASASKTLSAIPSTFTFNMASIFPVKSSPGGGALYSPGGHTLGPWGFPLWVYSRAGSAINVDDDLVVNGSVVEPAGYIFAGGLNGSHTVGHGGNYLLAYVAPGDTITLNVKDNFASTTNASGTLSCYRVDPGV